MKTRIAISMLLLSLAFVPAAFAQQGSGPTNPSSTNQGSGPTNPGAKASWSDTGGGVKLLNPLGGPGGAASLEELVNSVLSFVIRLGTIVVVVMMVYVGYLFVTARGNPGEISKAREALKWTVVGALILLGSQALTAGIIATVRALGGG